MKRPLTLRQSFEYLKLALLRAKNGKSKSMLGGTKDLGECDIGELFSNIKMQNP